MTLILSVAVTGTLLVAFMVGLLVWCRARKLRRKQKEEMIEFEQVIIVHLVSRKTDVVASTETNDTNIFVLPVNFEMLHCIQC